MVYDARSRQSLDQNETHMEIRNDAAGSPSRGIHRRSGVGCCNRLRRAADRAYAWLYPRRCPSCGEVLSAETAEQDLICGDCRAALPYVREPYCMKCGAPLAEEAEEYCTGCQTRKHTYIRGRALFLYVEPVRASLAALKYQNKREYAAFYGRELANGLFPYLRQVKPQLLIPIPLHRTRRCGRGYNQAELLAQALGGALSDRGVYCPMNKELLLRTRKTAPQKNLGGAERLQNLSGAFEARKEVLQRLQEQLGTIRRVLLVDDIYTTGSTIEACTRALQTVGIQEVYFVAVCVGRQV